MADAAELGARWFEAVKAHDVNGALGLLSSDVDFQAAGAAMRGLYVGTHGGTLHSPAGDIPPTGKQVAIPFVSIFEAEGDHITSHRAYWDQMAFMAQLGLVPPPA